MFEQIVLDLGEDYGEISVAAIPKVVDEGLVEAGLVEDTAEAIKVKLQDVLSAPLTGLGMALRAALPRAEVLDNETYQMEGFSVEFQIGLETETGVDIGVVAKIIPSGSFNCTYSWKRK